MRAPWPSGSSARSPASVRFPPKAALPLYGCVCVCVRGSTTNRRTDCPTTTPTNGRSHRRVACLHRGQPAHLAGPGRGPGHPRALRLGAQQGVPLDVFSSALALHPAKPPPHPTPPPPAQLYSWRNRGQVPVRSILLTGALALPFLFLSSIEVIARATSVCFLTMYR